MNLQDALLCADCEAIYSFSDRCPRCGSKDATRLGHSFDPDWPLAVTEVSDPVQLLRACRESRRRRLHDFSTVAVLLVAGVLGVAPLGAAVTGGETPSPASSQLL